jgi:ABC-2 type transport system permease protein
MLMLFGIPVVQILLFGYVVTMDIKNFEIAVLDKSNDNVTKEITDKLVASGYFVLNRNITTNKEIDELFRKGEVKEVIVFEDNFGKKLQTEGKAGIQILVDASEANIANLMVSYTSNIVNDYIMYKMRQDGLPVQIIPKVRMLFNESLKSVYMFVPGTIAMILILISAMMTSISIAREKELGTMEILLVSPLRPTQIIIGKVIPYMVFSFINAIIILILSFTVFNVPMNGSIVLLLMESILYILLSLSIGIFISTIASTQQLAMFISLFALFMPTFFLSGFIFPIENMPNILQWLSCVNPSRWFTTIIRNIMLKGSGFIYVWKETLIMIGITSLFIILTIRKYKTRLE